MKTLTRVPTGYAIREVDLPNAPDALIDQAVALQHVLDAEARPEDPPKPAEQIAAQYRVTSEMGKRTYWGAFQGDQLVGGAGVWQNLVGSNLDHRDVWIAVHPEHRRRGLGRSLFATAIASISGDDIIVNGWTTTRVPSGGKFAERVGAKAGLVMRTSQLDLASIDRALMREWASIDPKGYRIEWLLGPVPDHLMQNVLDALNAINRMPKDDLKMEDWIFTAPMIRDWERMQKARGQEHWMVLALDDKGGSAGFTDIAFDPRYPHLIQQRGTATVLEHQGKGIGKWMKAHMILRILEELPMARFIRTDNAGTNKAMLGINIKMGFTPAWEDSIWQESIADARRYAER